jgi:hypothetical protein
MSVSVMLEIGRERVHGEARTRFWRKPKQS